MKATALLVNKLTNISELDVSYVRLTSIPVSSVHQKEGSTPYGLNFPLRFLVLPFKLKGRFPFIFAPLEDIYRMLSRKRYFGCNRRRSNFLSQC